MTKKTPGVSVVMSVFNGEAHVATAVESILNQSYRDFEFIIVDDGCTDSTPEVLRSFKDPRITMVTQSNRGLAVALNKGIAKSKGRYIARMDSDDIAVHTRLETQYRFLEDNPGIGLVGTWIRIVDDKGNVLRQTKEPVGSSEIRKGMATYNCFNHGTVMFRRSIFDKAGGYSTTFPESVPVEDYALWLRMLKYCEGANIPEYLYLWRQHAASTSSTQRQKQAEQFFLVSEAYIKSKIVELEKRDGGNDELAFYHYCLGKIHHHHRGTDSRKHLKTALRLDPFVAPKAYWYLGLSFVNNKLADKIRRLRDSFLM